MTFEEYQHSIIFALCIDIFILTYFDMQHSNIPQYLDQSPRQETNNEDSSTFTFSPDQHDNPELPSSTQHPSLKPFLSPQNQQQADLPRQNNLQRPSSSHDQKRNLDFSPPSKYQNTHIFTPKPDHARTATVPATNDEDEGENSYKQLTLKLQSALNKISVSGKGLSKSVSQSDDIWKRSQIAAQRRNRELQQRREESERQKLKELKPKPVIDSNSIRLAKEVGHEPIYLRAQKLALARKKKLEEDEQSRKRQKEVKEEQFMQELNRCMRKPTNARTSEQFFGEMVRWKERAGERNRQKLEEQQTKELQEATFRPAINTRSQQLLLQGQPRAPIDQRGLLKPKPKPEGQAGKVRRGGR